MLAVQARMPFGMPIRPRTRNVRRPFTPSFRDGPYHLPNAVKDRLALALAPYRNREAAFALATFIGRFWSCPDRIVENFAIDRRALAEHPALGLSERQVRSAIRVLEEIGFIDRALVTGSKYKPTEEGLRRKPIRFQFGSDYFPLFDAANKRAAAARGGRFGERRTIPSNASRPSVAVPEASGTKCPKWKTSEADRVYLGHQVETKGKIGLPPRSYEPDPKLEAALERLRRGVFGKAEGGSSAS
jgi:hypothetical protein